ncbi:MAG: hypothetical protein ACYDDA_13715 [Acidiferrobacteraceae bacterium]
MGEYAMYGGQQIKIGTCEQMYYLRADQAHKVAPLPGNVDPVAQREHIRFRFPFPDEDHVEPGAFENYERTQWLHGMTPPVEIEHYSIQFQGHAAAGTMLLSVPCPMGPGCDVLKVGRNGYMGDVGIHSQRCLGSFRMLVCRCGGCGALYRVPTLDEAMPYVNACKAEAERLERQGQCLGYDESTRAQWLREASYWLALATRIVEGYRPGAGDLPQGPPPASRPEPEPDPVPPPANDTASASRHLNVAEACAELRTLLRKATYRSWSVTHGRGTAYGWITVHAMPKDRLDGYLTNADARTLAALFGESRPVHHQGLSISPDARGYYVAQLSKGARYVLTPSTCVPLAPFPKAAP